MTLANDPAASSTQGKMHLSSLLRLCIADFPTLPANFFFGPVVVLPLLPLTPLALMLPLLPMTPLALLLPPYTFRFKLVDDAFVLRHPVQNFETRSAQEVPR